ncbi:nucleoside triphosphate pyrophosphohydrolase [Coriobacteriia bacterium Es71-Z0120]|uniref:nucleoside triphosphate pyrophosphohydrolase n=1 Tax=Parvivirga hydrogeniphila TaxID=2939460 RepID=UPI002260DB90|nr:nucleoside triphosphate pyrophosphohydrolase [Parvivirga hydrogeniphila]MCL4078396.1 nucleoside triphosphate pyrophosphohydrolase [Parvivirga hydrogeniphila]
MGSIAIVGLERDASGALDERAAARIARADAVVVASAEGAAAAAAREAGAVPLSYADLGLAPDAPAGAIVEALAKLADGRDVVLLAAGFPFVRDGVVSGLLARRGASVDVYPLASPLQVLLLALELDVTADAAIVDADSLPRAEPRRDTHLVVTGIDNAAIARAVGKALARTYAPEHSVVLASPLSDGGFDLASTTVASLERTERCERGTVAFVAPSRIEPPDGFDELVRIVDVLRSPGGCPWDREQTHETLAKHMLEEAYEAVHAIEEGDLAALKDELGDVLLQVVLHARIGSEEGTFGIDEVISGIIAKIRRRHPHIFGSVEARTPDEVMRNWDAIKRGEREERGDEGGVLSGVTPSLPALMYAQKLSKRAAAAGFEWPDIEGVWAKVHEEIDELKAAPAGSAEAADEVGDLLFTVVNVARHLGVDAEDALRRTCAKFVRRFEKMERAAQARGVDVRSLSIEEYDVLWEQAKSQERSGAGPSEEEAR